jgi:hypothetical protein
MHSAMMGHSSVAALFQCEPVLAANLRTRVLCELTDKSLVSEELEPFQSRFGSKTEVAPLEQHVRSTLKSRHRRVTPASPFRANSEQARTDYASSILR